MKSYLTIVLFAGLINISSAQTETKVPTDSLPPAAKAHLGSKFRHYRVAKIVKVTDKALLITYKVEARKDEDSNTITCYDLVYNEKGELKSKKKSKEYGYDGTEPEKPKPAPHRPDDGHNH